MERKELHESLEKLNHALDNLFDLLTPFSNHALNQSPGNQKWSPTQIMNHLLMSEKLSIAYCRKKLSFNPKLKRAGIMSFFKTQIIRFYLYSPLKFKAPKLINTPFLPASDTLDNIIIKWHAVRSDMKSFIEEIAESDLDKEIYKHPFGGRISISGMLSFMEAHFENHRRQILNALKKAK
jgi:hypothetical protein